MHNAIFVDRNRVRAFLARCQSSFHTPIKDWQATVDLDAVTMAHNSAGNQSQC